MSQFDIKMTALADAIKAKNTTVSGKLSIDEMTLAVNGITVGGGGIDTSDATATAAQILYGATAYVNGIKITGNIKTVTATLADNVVTVPAGYIAQAKTLTVAEMSEPSVSANVVTIGKGYNKAQKTVTIPEAGKLTVTDNTVTVPVGFIASERVATVAVASAPSVDANVVTVYKGYTTKNTEVVIPEAVITDDGEKISISVGYNKTNQQFNINSGGVILPEGITVKPTDVLNGVYYIDAEGSKQVGTMANRGIIGVELQKTPYSLPNGYYERIDIPAAPESGGGTGDSTIKFGYWTADGKFQQVDLSGDAPVDSGEPIAVDAVMFKTGKPEPEYPGSGGCESSIEFYECASYTPDADAYTKYYFTLSGAPDEKANGTYVRKKYIENVSDDVESMTTSTWQNDNGYTFSEEYEYGEWRYYLKNSTGYYIYGLDASMPRLTDFNSTYWVDWDYWESVPLVFSAWQTEEVPATTEGWTGYKVTQDNGTGAWMTSDVLTTGLTVAHLKPKPGEIYSSDTTIRVRKMYDGTLIPIPQDGLIFYAPLQYDYTDVVSKIEPLITGGEFAEYNGKQALYFDGSAQWVHYGSDGEYPQQAPYSVVISLVNSSSDGARWRDYLSWGIHAKNDSINERTSRLENGRWYTAVVVNTSAGSSFTRTVYLNGVLAGTREESGTLTFSQSATIGAGNADGGCETYLHGYVADAAIYDRELTSDEILEIHNILMEGVVQ